MYEVTSGKSYKKAAGPAGPKPSGKTVSPEAGGNPAPGMGVSTDKGRRVVEHAHAPGKAGTDAHGAKYGNVGGKDRSIPRK